ncbi:hypothetical protein NRS6096_22095 (plasmid) [Bacillus subtilis]|nr:hypothetical protein NRS6096_22095 [Bacillus subtilis]
MKMTKEKATSLAKKGIKHSEKYCIPLKKKKRK